MLYDFIETNYNRIFKDLRKIGLTIYGKILKGGQNIFLFVTCISFIYAFYKYSKDIPLFCDRMKLQILQLVNSYKHK